MNTPRWPVCFLSGVIMVGLEVMPTA